MIRRSKAEIYLHFVWAAYRRLPLITPEIERQLYACILSEARRMDCTVLAMGGMPDHVHLAVDLPPKLAPAKLMQQVKGASSALVRRQLSPGELFGWQDGYGVYSFSRSHRTRVISYIQRQKEHHEHGSTWSVWEETGEDFER